MAAEMNRFEALGIATSALEGNRIVVVLSRLGQMRRTIDAVDQQARHICDNVRTLKSNGEERVEVGSRGGEVVFTFRRSSRLAEYQADIVLIEDTAPMSDTELARLSGIARGGQVVRR